MIWVYTAEVCVDSASGLAIAAKYINLTIISLTFEFMINSDLSVHGTIWYFAACNFIGFFFCVLCLRETRGLTDKQKKMVYTVKSFA